MFAIDGRDEPDVVNLRRERFPSWFERNRPSAIISNISEVKMLLEGAGLEIPVEVSIAALSRILDPAWSGIV